MHYGEWVQWLIEDRGTERELVARLLARDTAEIQIGHHCEVCRSTEHGAPYLTRFPDSLAISISHAGRWTAVAINRTSVGIDIELSATEVEGLAPFTLDTADVASLTDPPSARQAALILQRWVMKEAVVKAAGVGLTIDLGALMLRPIVTNRWLATSPELDLRYVVGLLDAREPLTGALATIQDAGRDWEVHVH